MAVESFHTLRSLQKRRLGVKGGRKLLKEKRKGKKKGWKFATVLLATRCLRFKFYFFKNFVLALANYRWKAGGQEVEDG